MLNDVIDIINYSRSISLSLSRAVVVPRPRRSPTPGTPSGRPRRVSFAKPSLSFVLLQTICRSLYSSRVLRFSEKGKQSICHVSWFVTSGRPWRPRRASARPCRRRSAPSWPPPGGIRGNHSSDATSLTQVFFKRGEEGTTLWCSLKLWTTHKTNEAAFDK